MSQTTFRRWPTGLALGLGFSVLALAQCNRGATPAAPSATASASASGTATSAAPPSAVNPSASASVSASASATASAGPTARWQNASPVRNAAGDGRSAVATGALFRGTLLSLDDPEADGGLDPAELANAVQARAGLAALARAHTRGGALAIFGVPLLDADGYSTRSGVFLREVDVEGRFTGPVRFAAEFGGVLRTLTAHTNGPHTWVAGFTERSRGGVTQAIALHENGARVGLVQRMGSVNRSMAASAAVAVYALDDGGALVVHPGEQSPPGPLEQQDAIASGLMTEMDMGEDVSRWLFTRLDPSHHGSPARSFVGLSSQRRDSPRDPEYALAQLGLGTGAAGPWFSVAETRQTRAYADWVDPTHVHGDGHSNYADVRIERAEPGQAPQVVLIESDREPSTFRVRTIRLEATDGGFQTRTERDWQPLSAAALRCTSGPVPVLTLTWAGGSIDLDPRDARDAPAWRYLYRAFTAREGELFTVQNDLVALHASGDLVATDRVLVHFDGFALRRFACRPGTNVLAELGP